MMIPESRLSDSRKPISIIIEPIDAIQIHDITFQIGVLETSTPAPEEVRLRRCAQRWRRSLGTNILMSALNIMSELISELKRTEKKTAKEKKLVDKCRYCKIPTAANIAGSIGPRPTAHCFMLYDSNFQKFHIHLHNVNIPNATPILQHNYRQAEEYIRLLFSILIGR